MNDIKIIDNEIAYSGFKLLKNGIEPIGTPTFEQWEEAGEFIKKADGAVHLWLGDWLNYGETHYGETYSQAMDATNFDYQTLSNDKWVSSKIPLSFRKETLSNKHYQTIAGVGNIEERKEWIDKTDKNQWTVSQLKQQIKSERAKKLGKRSIDVKASLYGDNIYYNSGEKSEARWDDHIIHNEKYPTITRMSRFFHTDGIEFSLREYAQVQDFPDTYKFVGNYSTIKSQIGNAVSPKMASYIGKKLTGHTFIDLFAGCGGLSCGLEQIRRKAIYANEIEPNYFMTYIINHPDTIVDINDIHNIEGKDIPDADIIVGGPPCQGFSLAGLRLKDDPRNELYKQFLRIVKEKQVKEFLMENVPQIEDIKEQIIEDFAEIGYETTFQIVKGEEIGMKQTRHRAFFIGKKI